MEFTREPIIETIITPREGYKLIVRSSKGKAEEEFAVDAVEVVSFGGAALFFRSQERPKSFLLPVSDYEVLELRETRAVLKAPAPEKSIKIGGSKEQQGLKKETEEAAPAPASEVSEGEKRRDRHKMKKKKRHERKREEAKTTEETKTPQTTISRLLPPPPSLISETLTRFKQAPMGEQPVPSEISEEVPLPQGITPEEPEVEREQPITPEPKHEEAAPQGTQVPDESATPDNLPTQTQKDFEEDEPSETTEEKASSAPEEHFRAESDHKFMF